MSDWTPPGATAQSSVNVGAITITIPTNVLAGDFLELTAACTASASVTWTTPTSPGTWAIAAGPQMQGTSLSAVVYTHVAAAGDAGTNVLVNFTGSQRAAAVMRVYRNSAGILDVTSPAANTGNSTNPQAPAITTTTNGDTITPIVIQRIPQGNLAGSWTDPTGYGNKLVACSQFTGSNSNVAIAAYGTLQTTHGANSAVTVPSAFSGAWIGFTVAIRTGSPAGPVRVVSETHAFSETFDTTVGPHGPIADSFSETVPWGDDSLTTVVVIGGGVGAWTVELSIGGTWTDITNYVPANTGIAITRGRDHEFDTVQPGTCDLTLENFDGRFTPGAAKLANGVTPNPYYPYIRVNTPIRVMRHVDGITSARFTGFVDGWPLSWDGGVLSHVAVSATDVFKLFEKHTLRDGWIEQAVADGATVLYPLDDPDGSATVGDVLGNGPPGVLVTAKQGGSVVYQQPGPFASGATVMRFAPSGADGGVAASFGHHPLVTAVPFTISFWFRSFDAGHIDGPIYHQSANRIPPWEGRLADPNYSGVWIGEGRVAGTLRFYASNQGRLGQESWAQTSSDYADGLWHAAVCGIDLDSRTPFLYVDKVSQTVIARSLLPLDKTSLYTSVVELAGDSVNQQFFNGEIGGFTVYPGVAFTTGQVHDHYDAGDNGFTGEKTDARARRLLSYGGITNVSIEPGYSTCGAQDTAGKTLRDALQAVETTEQGLFFIAGDGTPTFYSRYHTSGTPLELTGVNIDPSFTQGVDDALLVNSITVTGVSASTATAEDTDSQGQYGVYSDTKDTVLDSIVELQAFADYRIAKYSQPTPRTPSLSIDVLTQPILNPFAAVLDLGALISTSSLPPEAAAVPTLSVERMTESISTEEHRITVATGPAELGDFGVWDVTYWDDGSVWAW